MMVLIRYTVLIAFVFLSSLGLLTACSEDKQVIPSSIRVGVLPDEAPEFLRKKYTPLLKHLSQSTGIPHTLKIPKDYGDLLELFKDKKIELAYFGGFTFLKAQVKHGAVSLVMRDVDLRFSSYFLVRAGEKGQSLKEFRDRPFAFGSKLSTSGHLMPRYFMMEKGLDPENLFSEVKYSGAHDKTVKWVRDGHVAVGAVNAQVVDRMYQVKSITPDRVRILLKTPPYPDYVWAVQGDIPSQIVERITEGFLELSTSKVEHAEILKPLGAKVFFPAHIDDFRQLKSVATKLGLI